MMADRPGLKTPGLHSIGNNLAIDFVNTRVAHSSTGGPLRNADDVVAFLAENGALTPGEATAERRRLRDVAASSRFMRRAIALRNAIAGILERISAARQAAQADIAVLNAALKSAAGYRELHRGAGARYALAFRALNPDATQALAPIARAAAELLTADRPPVRKCANAKCIIWFYDSSRTGRRRWCDMALCGNRAKVSAFQQRQRSRV